MNKRIHGGIVAIWLASVAGTAQAAIINVEPKLQAILAEDFTRLDPSTYQVVGDDIYLPPNGGKRVLQVDFLLTIDDLQGDQLGFGNTNVQIDIAGGIRAPALSDWFVDRTRVDSNGPNPGGLVDKWSLVEMCAFVSCEGENFSVLMETAPRSFWDGDTTTDPRRSLAIAPYNNPEIDPLGRTIVPHDDGEYFGTVFVEFDSIVGAAQVTITAAVIGGSTYDSTYTLRGDGTTGGPARTLTVYTPEPSALALLALSIVGFVGLRRRLRLA